MVSDMVADTKTETIYDREEIPIAMSSLYLWETLGDPEELLKEADGDA